MLIEEEKLSAIIFQRKSKYSLEVYVPVFSLVANRTLKFTNCYESIELFTEFLRKIVLY